ncbi:unnamed protein product [Anisakis simplex]|uniref:HUN domain-containing protein n=1 Tax=Anisakis simplex TaxID=6269 RepID=A0A0M3JIT4_ANISI|nr:unnamed protein product [Anisakis simplex]
MNKKRNEIPVDERYLHRFAVLKPKVKTEATSKEGRKKGDFEDDFDDVESVNSDEFNLLLGKDCGYVLIVFIDIIVSMNVCVKIFCIVLWVFWY